MKILIGGAWPYSNYKLHLGHAAGLIGGDLLARYHRAKGDDVIYVSGSDCHGTPITERAKKEGISPAEISEKYHNLFVEAFDALNFSYDLYTKTETDYHKSHVMEIVKKMYDNGYIYEKIEPQAFCPTCNKFLADRELQITCPNCGRVTKCDSCDCGYVPTEKDQEGATCTDCGTKAIKKDNKNLYIALSKMQPEIEKYVAEKKSNWRINAQNETEKYLREGLRDRAITRDLNWGIDVPVPGYEDKKLYVWIEAVLGYVTASLKVCEERGLNFDDYWKNPNSKIYMVHGKDNITFHTLIFPGILFALQDGMRFPDVIVSSEYLNFNDEKISKSKGNAKPVKEFCDEYNSDTVRFHLINNGPEKKDTSFNVLDYVTVHNNEITNKYGNFVNRTLKFKGISEIPQGKMDEDIKALILKAYDEVSHDIETLEFKEASSKVIRLIEDANKYYDDRKPWVQFKEEDKSEFNNTIYTCAVLIANISNLMEPFMPASSAKIREWLKIEKATWNYIEVEPGISLENVDVLFTKFDEKDVIAKIKAEAKEQEKRRKEEEKLAQKEGAKLEEITIDYLDKVSLKVAKILSCEKVEGSEKLYKLMVSLGNEERQIVSGLQKYYKEEELIGKKVVLVANLKPAKLKGVESNGMILAAGDGDNVKVLLVDDSINEGESIS
ncbi:MAG: methionine--tRNA ligase [Clostridia bacterium]|nr:methionine--tRNA ligase [Clostridia bacterium]